MRKEIERLKKELAICEAELAHRLKTIKMLEYEVRNQKAIHEQALKKKKTFIVETEGLGLSGDRKQNAVNMLAHSVAEYIIENEDFIPIYNNQFLDDECTKFELTVAFLDRFHI